MKAKLNGYEGSMALDPNIQLARLDVGIHRVFSDLVIDPASYIGYCEARIMVAKILESGLASEATLHRFCR